MNKTHNKTSALIILSHQMDSNGELDKETFARIELAIELYKRKKFDFIITSGRDYKDNSDISDTFLLSWILSYVDYSVLNMFTDSNRFCIMNGKNGKISRYGKWDNIKDDNQNIVTSNDYFKHDYFNQSYSNLIDDYQLEYMTKDEEKELKRISKKYDMDKDEIIHDYLDFGYSIFDIESAIDNELKYYNEAYYQ